MQITGATQLFGLIGDPVSQARTPAMANECLARRKQLGPHVLVPMHVTSDGLEQFVSGLRAMQNFGGAVVTMPHKTRMATLVDELTPESTLVGAVNVIRRHANGQLTGTVLDGEGFVGGLQAAGHAVAGKACVLVGAGTSLGMKPFDPLPMDEALMDRTTLVAECVISPEITALLEVAKRRGCQIHTGVPMLAAQINLMLAFMGIE